MLKLTNNLLPKYLKQVGQVLRQHKLNPAVTPVRDLWVTRIISEAITGELPPHIATKQQKNATKVANDPFLKALDEEVARQLQQPSPKVR